MASSKVATGSGCKWFQTMVTIPAKSRGVHKITDYITSKYVAGTFILSALFIGRFIRKKFFLKFLERHALVRLSLGRTHFV